MGSFLSAVSTSAPGSRFELIVEDTGRVVVPDLQVAIDSATRKKGLLGRDGLPAGSGLVIAPSNAVHTFFMRFAIDILFLSRDGRVLKLKEAVPAWRLAGAFRGYAVLELGAGQARIVGLEVGQRVKARRRESQGAGSFV
jgi:uncharacterized membrane protein (UPF0127 family)